MTRYFLAADCERGNWGLFVKILEAAAANESDIIFAGDFGLDVARHAKELHTFLEEKDLALFSVPGNWDSEKSYNAITSHDRVIDLHMKVADDFVGYGGAEGTPWLPGADPKHWYCRKVDRDHLAFLLATAREHDAGKMVLHQPPLGFVDFGRSGDHDGDPDIKSVLDETYWPRLVVTAHAHYPTRSYDRGGVLTDKRFPAAITPEGRIVKPYETVSRLVINPGPSCDGMYALVDDHPKKRTVTYIGHRRILL